MSPASPGKLQRLLAPRQVALIGGHDAGVALGECRRIGFAGEIWPVNPRRAQLGGLECFARVEDLPRAPDAAFVAVAPEAAIETLARLHALGAGGAVVYTAGFSETGAAGTALEQRLLAAAGDMALVGPNCYGLINYLDRVALWPFAHGGGNPGYGAAIVTQSGMLASDLSMSQRSLPLACLISAGNQAQLGAEDYIAALLQRPEVRAIGLHIEGLRDVAAFARAASAALSAGVPLVALKTGTSRIGAELAVTHTGSLSGTSELYQALFERLGIVRVDTPAELVETLKYLCVAGVPHGRRIAGLTCSGGGAALLADLGEAAGLAFPQPGAARAERLRERLPPIATVCNPLDYTTPIWGDAERVPPVFEALFDSDNHDAAVIVQDYPAPGLDESKPCYLRDARAFVEAVRAAGLPGAVCSTLAENFDRETRDYLVAAGVAPMQGIAETVRAIAAAAGYGEQCRQLAGRAAWSPLAAGAGPITLLDEALAKACLRGAGLAVPAGRAADAADLAETGQALGYPLALKALLPGIAHKTEAGAVALALTDGAALIAARTAMRSRLAGDGPYLVERMQPPPVAELLVGIRGDAVFGLALTLASGGVLTELVHDAVTVLLPAGEDDFRRALRRLRVSRLLDGYRGAPPVDRTPLLAALQTLADFAQHHAGSLAELEINPLFVYPTGVCAVDAVLRVTDPAPFRELARTADGH